MSSADIINNHNLANNSNDVFAVLLNNHVRSLNANFTDSKDVKYLTISDEIGNRIYAAGLKMVFEYAVKRAFPYVSVSYAFSVPKGIVAEIEHNQYLKNEDISLIKKEMTSIVNADLKIEKLVVKRNDAIEYFRKINSQEKQENIKSISDNTVILYRINDFVNYYYSEMPVSTRVINKFELKYLGKNLVVINFPSASDNGSIPDFVNYKGIIDSYIDSKEWLEEMHVPFVYNVNKKIQTKEIKSFIRSSELNFNIGINETAREISNNRSIKCVMLTGPSSSGKTTITKRLANYFEIYGLDPIVISLDDYFKDRVDTPKDENGDYDFECLQALNIKMLNDDVIKLLNNEEITLPSFNFFTGKSEITNHKVKLKRNSIILFEGLHAINNDLLPMIPDTIKYKIYISPYMPLCIDKQNFISSEDLRLIRRIVRDFRTRGYDVESTIKNCKNVRKGEDKYIIPFIHQADKIINTSLAYEIGVLRVFVEPLLYSVDDSSAYYSEARRLIKFLKHFFPISAEYVPIDSILREFIGGMIDD